MFRVFLLSPANCSGKRAKQMLSPRASSPLAEQLRAPSGAKLGDVFSFVSALYFRGKLTYASRFANSPAGPGVQIITPNNGLQTPDASVTDETLRGFAGDDIDASNARYRGPLEASARRLAERVGADCDIVLLGSVASPKYVDVLLGIFGERLRFPLDFVGRGDMSRGGLLLRKAHEGLELEYGQVAGAVLHGQRPPRLTPLRTSQARVSGRMAERI